MKEDAAVNIHLLPVLVKLLLETHLQPKFIELSKLLTFRSSLSVDVIEDQMRAVIFSSSSDQKGAAWQGMCSLTALEALSVDHCEAPLRGLDLGRHIGWREALGIKGLDPIRLGRPAITHFVALLMDPQLLVELVTSNTNKAGSGGKPGPQLDVLLKQAPQMIQSLIDEAMLQFERLARTKSW